jgi:hypothetical protein
LRKKGEPQGSPKFVNLRLRSGRWNQLLFRACPIREDLVRIQPQPLGYAHTVIGVSFVEGLDLQLLNASRVFFEAAHNILDQPSRSSMTRLCRALQGPLIFRNDWIFLRRFRRRRTLAPSYQHDSAQNRNRRQHHTHRQRLVR